MPTYYAHQATVSLGEEATAGTTATTSAHYPLHMESVTLPDEAADWKTIHAVGAGRDWNAVSEGKHTLEKGTLEGKLIKGDILFYAFGQVTETGTAKAGGGSSTLTSGLAAGVTVIPVASAASLAAGDMINIGANDTYPEVREIASIDGLNVTVTKAIRLAKTTGKTVVEVEAPYTHTLSVGNEFKSFTVEASIDSATDYVRKFNGCYVNGMKIDCEEGGELNASFPLIGMNTSAAGTTATTVSIPTTAPYLFNQGAITCMGGAIATVNSFGVDMKNNMKGKHYIQSTNGLNVYEVGTGKRNIEITMSAVPQSNAWTERMRPGAQSAATTFSAVFTRATSTDVLTLSATGVYLKDLGQPVPEEGEFVTDMTLIAKTLSATVIDSTPYYLMV